MSAREQAVIAERVRTRGTVPGRACGSARTPRSPADRFTELEKAFGASWKAIPLNSKPGNPDGIGKREHSVLTSADVDQPGHPTHEARAQVTTFLRQRLSAE